MSPKEERPYAWDTQDNKLASEFWVAKAVEAMLQLSPAEQASQIDELPGTQQDQLLEQLNPWFEKWGAEWEQKVAAHLWGNDSDSGSGGHVCVTELIDHMMLASAELMAGTAHEYNDVIPRQCPHPSGCSDTMVARTQSIENFDL